MITENDMTAELERLGKIETNIEYIQRDIQEIKTLITERNSMCTVHAEDISNHKKAIKNLEEKCMDMTENYNGLVKWLIATMGSAVLALIVALINILSR